MCFIEVVGAALFFVTSFYVVRDKQNVDIAIQGELELVVDGWMDFCSIRGVIDKGMINSQDETILNNSQGIP